MTRYYANLVRFGVLGLRPVNAGQVEPWCFFSMFKHLCFNPAHAGFRRTAHMFDTVLPDHLRFLESALRVLLCCLYLPLMLAFPFIAWLAAPKEFAAAVDRPFEWLDKRFRSQKDQTPLGLMNTSVDLTILAHRQHGDDLLDKRTFFEHCGPLGLPTIACLDKERPPAEGQTVWRKPRRGGNGEGHGKVVADAPFLQALAGLSAEEVIQPVLRNHRDLCEIASDTLASLRVLTLHDSGGRPELFGLVDIKFARGSLIQSNVSAGGLVVLVDGRGRMLGSAHDLQGRAFAQHPDTGASFTGRQVPMYEEAVQLCLHAHEQIAPDLFVVGWDVALTDEKPVLIEPNIFAQLATAVRESDVPIYKQQLVTRLERLYAEGSGLLATWRAWCLFGMGIWTSALLWAL